MSGIKRVFLSLEERVKVLEEREKGTSERKLAVLFKCGKTQINKILKNRDRIWKEWKENGNTAKKRKRQEKYELVNDLLIEWYKSARSKNIRVGGNVLKTKALQIATLNGIEGFTASNGWLNRFRVRHNIFFRSINGEVNNSNSIAYNDWENCLPSLVEGYAAKDIYIMDEFGLLFRNLPSKSLAIKSEQCKGGMLPEERLTLAFCVSCDGTKEPPLIIGYSPEPLTLIDKDNLHEKFSWYFNKKSWMTSLIFETWLSLFDSRMCREERKVLLFLDKAPCHIHQLKLKNVGIRFLPRVSDFRLQPLRPGVVHFFKLHYRRRLLQHLLSCTDRGLSATELASKITDSEAVSWIVAAWQDVGCSVIHNCLHTYGFPKVSEESTEIKVEYPDDVERLSHELGIEFDAEAAEEDENLECFDDLSGDWEERVYEDGYMMSSEIDDEYPDDANILASSAVKVNYDKEASEEDEHLECYDDEDDNKDWDESEDPYTENQNEEYEENGGDYIEAEDSKMTAHEILLQLDKCHQALCSSDYHNKDKMNDLLVELKSMLEKEIQREQNDVQYCK